VNGWVGGEARVTVRARHVQQVAACETTPAVHALRRRCNRLDMCVCLCCPLPAADDSNTIQAAIQAASAASFLLTTVDWRQLRRSGTGR
jgi:hypothetical protein